tara:strand:- start:615 stop:734 length:120 start_codon:yes stop_codon:yes gene_type:complete
VCFPRGFLGDTFVIGYSYEKKKIGLLSILEGDLTSGFTD